MSVVVSGDFFRFRLALPSLLILSKDEVKAAHSDIDRCPCGGGLRTENPPDRHFSQPYFTIYDHCTLGHVSISKLSPLNSPFKFFTVTNLRHQPC